MFFSFHFLFRKAAIVLVLFFSACVYVSVRDGEKDIWHTISWVSERKRLCVVVFVVFFSSHTPTTELKTRVKTRTREKLFHG